MLRKGRFSLAKYLHLYIITFLLGSEAFAGLACKTQFESDFQSIFSLLNKMSAPHFTCEEFLKKGTPEFRKLILNFKQALLSKGLEVEILPMIYAQMANESSFGTSAGSQVFNFGNKFQGKQLRQFSSTKDYVDFFLTDVQSGTYKSCLNKSFDNSLSTWEKAQNYIQCLEGGEKSWHGCELAWQNSKSVHCYCKENCADLYLAPQFSTPEALPSYGLGYGTYVNYKLGEVFLHSPDSCGMQGEVLDQPSQIFTAKDTARNELYKWCSLNEPLPVPNEVCNKPGDSRKFCSGHYSCYCQKMFGSASHAYNCYDVSDPRSPIKL